ncbi:MAG: ATP-binding protein [Cyanobacteriota/Melainabacteria group bacterium]
MMEKTDTQELTYDDVVGFLGQRKPENFVLDYKLQVNDKAARLAKTIASMANTYGGTIIIGVNEENEIPKEPFEGYSYSTSQNIRQTVDNLIVEHIKTPVFVEFKECINAAGSHAFSVIRVPLSPLAPHSVGETNAYYIRTGQRTRQEDLAAPDKIIWLSDHRSKSLALRKQLVEDAFERFDDLHYIPCDSAGLAREYRPSRTICFIPLYPSGEIFRYDEARQKLQEASFPADELSYPPVDSNVESRSIAHGMFYSSSPQNPIPRRTLELNKYGMFMHRHQLKDFHLTHLYRDICRLVVFAG